MIKLYDHQKIGKDALLKHKKFCLFFGIGIGKTLTALSALHELPPSRVLIVAPKRIISEVWQVEDRVDVSQHEITYVSYSWIARNKDFAREHYDVVILDEVHRIKGATTKSSKILKIINNRATYVWGLTGTPVANSYLDVYNIYNNMCIKEFKESPTEFIYKYYLYRMQKIVLKNGYRIDTPIPIVPNERMIDDLVERIANHSMTKETKDCIDLPESTTKIVKVPGMITDTYKELSKGILRIGDYEDTMIKLETINKMHQAANGYIYDPFGGVMDICKNKKFDVLKEMLEDILEETERVIIVYYYQRDKELLETLPYDITTDSSEFKNNQILLLQYSQSEGLNLQYCNQMIFYTYDYSFLNYEQMCGRIYRNGQTRNVNYIVLIAKNTIEERIWRAINYKQSQDEYLKGVLKDD